MLLLKREIDETIVIDGGIKITVTSAFANHDICSY